MTPTWVPTVPTCRRLMTVLTNSFMTVKFLAPTLPEESITKTTSKGVSLQSVILDVGVSLVVVTRLSSAPAPAPSTKPSACWDTAAAINNVTNVSMALFSDAVTMTFQTRLTI